MVLGKIKSERFDSGDSEHLNIEGYKEMDLRVANINKNKILYVLML